ncbi:hypothetical protein PCH_Pc21g19780 [Penicillium rubens Wisconsin 54-1255]|uniref:Uncharacterized protein n=1 Tax=Penicillium rubens (strain ATCC 28089 / DSM 1075 / NRRL 1951 / Wisconsin 54-1255) TaxID=500485 RepID=B6HJX6_PENRW|nr:hypothetical protein PCH_Pc21g19780 [Penicillium rubens Wisconsin 54-1255]
MRGFYIKLAAFDLSHWCPDQTPQFPRSFHVKPTSEALPLPPYSDTTRGLFFPHSDRLFNHTTIDGLLMAPEGSPVDDATGIEFADDTFSWPQDGKSFTGLVALHPYYFSRCNLLITSSIAFYSTIQDISSPLEQNRLRQFLCLPYYNHTAFAKEHGESYTMGHAEQCTNYLRHSIQCHADLTPMLWQKKDN